MSIDQHIDLETEDLAMDVFELADQGLEMNSLTAGHGLAETGASGVVLMCSSGCSVLCSA
jgi:hypothetical protein